MILKTQLLETPIIFQGGRINIIEFNEIHVFRRLIYALNQYIKEGEASEPILLFKKGKAVDISESCLIVLDFYNVEFQSATIIKKILKQLEVEYQSCESYQKLLQEINERVEEFSQKLFLNYHVDLIAKKLDLKDYLKLLSIKVDTHLYRTPCEQIILLIKMIAELRLYDLIVLVDLKKYCTEAQIIEIYKLSLYYEVNLLLLESVCSEKLLSYENKLIVEDDFSESSILN